MVVAGAILIGISLLAMGFGLWMMWIVAFLWNGRDRNYFRSRWDRG
jgi:hypothetical protein